MISALCFAHSTLSRSTLPVCVRVALPFPVPRSPPVAGDTSALVSSSGRTSMGSWARPRAGVLLACAAIAVSCCCLQGARAAAPSPSFGDNFEITGAEDHVKTSPDGQTWYLSLDNKTGK